MKKFLIFIYSLTLMSCKYSSPKKDNEKKIIDYYHGIVLNEQSEKLSGVRVVILEPGSKVVSTDNEGYFQIKDKKFNKINVQRGKKISFNKDGYVTDTVSTLLIGPNYEAKKRRIINNYFIYEIPDTIILRKNIF